MKHSEIARDSRGQALVEAALTMLLLFVFIFAIWEAGRLIQVQQTLTDAAREAARFAVAPLTQTLPGTLPTDSEIQTMAASYLAAASIRINSSSVLVERPVVIGETTFTRVRVPYTYRVITLGMFGMLNNLNLAGESIMRNETSEH